jgi:hypothetical protein
VVVAKLLCKCSVLKRQLCRDGSSPLRKTDVVYTTSVLNAAMRPRHRQTRASSLHNTREADARQNIADGTLSQNSRELKDGEVTDVTDLAPGGHGIAQDVEDIPDADHVPSSVVDEEEPPLEQARAVTPPSPLPQNKGKGRARTTSEDSVIVRPRSTTSPASRRDPSQDDDRPRRSRSTARPPRETRSRQSIADSEQRSECSSTSHHSSYDMGRHVMSTINLTHEMAEIKEQLAQSAAIRADARQRKKEAEEETAGSHLRLNNLEIVLRNVQRDTERKLKRARSHSTRESEPAAEKQQRERRDKRRMPPRQTHWKQRDRLTTPRTVNTARERKNQQERPGPSCKRYKSRSYRTSEPIQHRLG